MADTELPGKSLLRGAGMGPTFDAQSAATPYQAIARAGAELSGLGEKANALYDQVKQSQTRTKANQMQMDLTKLQSDHEVAMIKNPTNPDSWVPDYTKALEDVRQKYLGEGASPYEQQVLGEAYTSFAGRSTAQIAQTAAIASFTNEKASLGNMLNEAERTGNRDLQQRAISGLRAMNVPGPEVDKAASESNRRMGLATAGIEVMQDPKEYREKLKSGWIPDGLSVADLPDLDSQARTAERRQTLDATEKLNDEIYSPDPAVRINDPKQIEEKYGWMGPAAVERAKETLANRDSNEMKAKAMTPEYQAEVVGRVNFMLSNYNPELDDYDSKYGDMLSAINTLPEGNGQKVALREAISAAREGKHAEIKTAMDQVNKLADDANKAGEFGNGIAQQTLQAVVDDGYLGDQAKMKTLGFTDTQTLALATLSESDLKKAGVPADRAKAIASGKTNSDRIEAFRLLFHQRQGQATAPAYEIEVANAIRDGKDMSAKLPFPSKVADVKANVAYGNVKIQLANWAKENPEDAKQYDKAFNKLKEFSAPYAVERTVPSVIQLEPPPPPFTAPGVSVSDAPGVLPDKPNR